MTQRLNASTMPEFIEVRYQSKGIKLISTIVIFVFLIPYAASVYKGLGFLFQQVFGIKESVILLIMMIVTALYLFMGGFMAASLADFIQGIIMIFGVILLIVYIVINPNVGGISNGISQLAKIDSNLTNMFNSKTALPVFSLVVLTSFGSWGLPQMVHKFYTIKDKSAIRTAKWVSTGFALLISFGAYFTGSLSRLILNNELPMVNGQPAFDRIMPFVIDKALPTFAAAIILILVLSASMSTLASVVLAASSTIAVDLVKNTLKPNIEQKKMLWLLRGLCVFFVLASYLLALGNNPILNLTSLSWGAISGCLFAPYLLGLYWKDATKNGVYTSIITATIIIVSGVIKYGVNSPYIPTVCAFAIIVPVITMSIASLVSSKFAEEHLDFIFNNKKLGVEK